MQRFYEGLKMPTPIKTLYKSINPTQLYTIPELITIIAQTTDISFTQDKFYKDIQKGYLKVTQLGGKNKPHLVLGSDLIDFFFDRLSEKS
jgi:hypothetical protein